MPSPFAGNDQLVDVGPVANLQKTLAEGKRRACPSGHEARLMESDRPEFDADAAELAYARTVEFPRATLTLRPRP